MDKVYEVTTDRDSEVEIYHDETILGRHQYHVYKDDEYQYTEPTKGKAIREVKESGW